MPKPMSKSQSRRAKRDQMRREDGDLPVQAEKKALLIYESGTIGVGPVEEPIPFDNTAEVYAWVAKFGAKAGIVAKKDVRLHRKPS